MDTRFQETVLRIQLVCAFVLFAALPLTAQDLSGYMAAPVPDRGLSTAGSQSLGQIESVNPATGNVMLSIPLGKLPPGPGGFTAGVTLVYNSAINDLRVSPVYNPAQTELGIQEQYINSSHGGGWNYGYQYTLWSNDRPQNSTICPGNNDCFKTYITTPDGANHLLRLTASVNTDGSAGPFFVANSNQSYYSINYSGANQLVYDGQPNPIFTGTLVYASVDSSFIRVEANTASQTWIATLPDGTQVRGPILTTVVGVIVGSTATQIIDRNGNSLSIGGTCADREACTETLTDLQGRTITLQYAWDSQSQVWTDTVTSPGTNGNLTTYVNWQPYAPNPSYKCQYFLHTPNPPSCNLSFTSLAVTSIQLPFASSTGAAAYYSFGYNVSGNSTAWGELHSLALNSLNSGADTTKCASSGSDCPQQYQVQYSYLFDGQPSSRVMGTIINPISSRVLTYQAGGGSTAPPETTSYSIPVPASFNPNVPPPAGGVSTVTHPDGSQTQVYSAVLCSNNLQDFCPAFVYKITNPDGTTAELAWTAGSAPPGSPTDVMINPYVQYAVQSVGTLSKATAITQDQNGNTLSINEYLWFDSTNLQRNGLNTSLTGIGTVSPSRTTKISYYTQATNGTYWSHGAPPYLRAKQTVMMGQAPTDCQQSTSCSVYSYDSPLTTANLTKQQRWDATNGVYITDSWDYLLSSSVTNGNVFKHTDPNGIVTQISYDGLNLYPTSIVSALDKPEKRTMTPSYNFSSGLLSTLTDDNSVVTSYTYDNLGRQTKARQSGGGLSRSTTTAYDDLGRLVTVTQDQLNLVSKTYLDALGRIYSMIDPAGNKVQKGYAFGSNLNYELQSNPYTSTDDATMGWTVTTRDSMGRVKTVQRFGKGATSSDPPPPFGGNANPTGTIGISYNQTSGNCGGFTTNITDEAVHVRKNCLDGFGRLTAVIDANSNLTTYGYDLLDDLISVNMGEQARRFEYNSAGRLTAACNPESANPTTACNNSPLPATGVERYTYDSNGMSQPGWMRVALLSQ